MYHRIGILTCDMCILVFIFLVWRCLILWSTVHLLVQFRYFQHLSMRVWAHPFPNRLRIKIILTSSAVPSKLSDLCTRACYKFCDCWKLKWPVWIGHSSGKIYKNRKAAWNKIIFIANVILMYTPCYSYLCCDEHLLFF